MACLEVAEETIADPFREVITKRKGKWKYDARLFVTHLPALIVWKAVLFHTFVNMSLRFQKVPNFIHIDNILVVIC